MTPMLGVHKKDLADKIRKVLYLPVGHIGFEPVTA